MRAAEEPRPVLWTSEIGTPVGRNLGRDCRDLRVGGRLRALSYINETIENVNNAMSEVMLTKQLELLDWDIPEPAENRNHCHRQW